MKLFTLLKRLFGREEQLPSANGPMDGGILLGLMEQIEHTREVELTCDEVLALMDQFAEMTLRGEDAAQYLPLVQQHLELCADCQEELDALMRILHEAPNGNP